MNRRPPTSTLTDTPFPYTTLVRSIRDAVKVVPIGALIGIVTGMMLTWLSPIRNATPEILARTEPNLLDLAVALFRSEEHTSELQSLMRISYAVFCLKKKIQSLYNGRLTPCTPITTTHPGNMH